ncbi:MAG: hypothetical protein HZB42_03155 [Sphingobacteriales bacterium]|nr:hypothetical protein [Sphingobacteriales bacterium]
MKKYLFTDGIGGIREAQSQEELESLIDASQNSDDIRIWIFNSNEWISYKTYRKMYPGEKRKEIRETNALVLSSAEPGKTNNKNWLKKFLFIAAIASVALLVVNFTRIKWEKAAAVNFIASRPANVPVMDMDSLIEEIEYDRNDILDRNTKNNLRLRNTWPDRIELKLNAERETNGSLSHYFNIDISIDNTTGFNLDKAILRLNTWKNGKLRDTDTIQFENIRYDKITARRLKNDYRGDSIAVSFESIRAKSFNFCYSAALKNSSGNYNDRWFCRGE